MAREILPPEAGQSSNMESYEKVRAAFQWSQVEPAFDWYRTGKINMAYECIDRHCLGPNKNKMALLYTDGQRVERYTFEDLMRLSNRFANALVRMGVTRGDRVFVFLPRVPETYVGILGILKVGAIPSPLFEAFMSDAVRDRMLDAGAVALLTNRHLLERVPENDLPDLKHVVLVGGGGTESGRHRSFDHEMDKSGERFDTVWLEREDPLILHYTSGSTGKPK